MSEDEYWRDIQTIAHEKFYINDAEEPAFLIVLTDKYRLFINHIGKIGFSISHAGIRKKLRKTLQTAKVPIRVFLEKNKRRRLFFKNSSDEDWLAYMEHKKQFESQIDENTIFEKTFEI